MKYETEFVPFYVCLLYNSVWAHKAYEWRFPEIAAEQKKSERAYLHLTGPTFMLAYLHLKCGGALHFFFSYTLSNFIFFFRLFSEIFFLFI